jgi:hypothetical protein
MNDPTLCDRPLASSPRKIPTPGKSDGFPYAECCSAPPWSLPRFRPPTAAHAPPDAGLHRDAGRFPPRPVPQSPPGTPTPAPRRLALATNRPSLPPKRRRPRAGPIGWRGARAARSRSRHHSRNRAETGPRDIGSIGRDRAPDRQFEPGVAGGFSFAPARCRRSRTCACRARAGPSGRGRAGGRC